MGFLDLADHAVMDDLYGRPVLGRRVNLNTHLGHQFVFFCVFGQGAGFCDIVGQWFLAINVQAHLHCGHSHAGMHVVGSRYVHAVKFRSFFFEHFAPIAIYFCRFETLLRLPAAIRIDFRYGGNQHILVGTYIAEIGTCHSSSSEACVPDGFAGG